MALRPESGGVHRPEQQKRGGGKSRGAMKGVQTAKGGGIISPPPGMRKICSRSR